MPSGIMSKLQLFLLSMFAPFWILAQVNHVFGVEDAEVIGLVKAPGFVTMGKSGSVSWKINIPENGYYNLRIKHRTPGGSKAQSLIKNRDTIDIGFAMTKDWGEFLQPFYFVKGSNKVGIIPDWGDMDIAWIKIEPASPALSISPHNQRFIKDSKNDLVYKIDNFNQKITGVFIDATPVEYAVSAYPFQESAVLLTIPSAHLMDMETGNKKLRVLFNHDTLQGKIEISATSKPYDLVIMAPYVEHGSSVLMRLPSGKYLMIDTGKDWVRDKFIIPILEHHHIDTIQTLFITHYHGDHDSDDKGMKIRNNFHVRQFIDYNTYPTGYEWELDGVTIKILNSFADGTEENTRSLVLKITYKGFTYMHSGDSYAMNEEQILKRFPGDIKANVFLANHHFHGSVLPEYLIKTDPDIVIVQAQEAIYARSAFMEDYKLKSEKILNERRQYPVETLIPLETGAVVIRVNSAGDWNYQTIEDQLKMRVKDFEKNRN